MRGTCLPAAASLSGRRPKSGARDHRRAGAGADEQAIKVGGARLVPRAGRLKMPCSRNRLACYCNFTLAEIYPLVARGGGPRRADQGSAPGVAAAERVMPSLRDLYVIDARIAYLEQV